MKEAKQVLLDDIRSCGEDGLWLAIIDMKYASHCARKCFGEEGLAGTLSQFEADGLIEYRTEGKGIDQKKYVVAVTQNETNRTN